MADAFTLTRNSETGLYHMTVNGEDMGDNFTLQEAVNYYIQMNEKEDGTDSADQQGGAG